jgi:CDP-diacylglycerol---serine O-phosphatidyltransferase
MHLTMEPAPSNPLTPEERELLREHRRRRFRRHGRRAYIRSVYFLPSLATLGNAICGFAAIYVSVLQPAVAGHDPLTQFFASHPFTTAVYLIFLAMVFDAIDGRLARFTRHTTDFGGQLDSLADAVSFGVAPAFLALQLFRTTVTDIPIFASRLIWAVGAVYVACALMRLARFNVSNEHGEQHHFSFLGLPSPGAAGTVVAFVLLQRELMRQSIDNPLLGQVAEVMIWCLPLLVLVTGLLMISNIRYPHMVNRYLRGRRSFGRLIGVLSLLLLIIVAHQYVIAIGTLMYALWGPFMLAYLRFRPRREPLPER